MLLHAFPTFRLGGAQARLVQLANAFGPRYHHLVVAMDGCFEAGERFAPSVTWEPVHISIIRGSGLQNRQAFRKVLTDLAPDGLFSYNWGAIEWAASNVPKRVLQVHVEDGFGPEEIVNQLRRRVLTRRFLLGFTRTPVVVASRHLERIAVHEWGLRAQRVRFIPNGVDALNDLEVPVAGMSGVLTIGTVAGLRAEKNVARLVRAFAAVRPAQRARLVIVGDGAERPALEALAATLGIQDDVEFTGYLKEPLARLREFDLFALSSDTEQLPISMLEAMACGVPIVATRVGDVADIVPAVAQDGLSDPTDSDFENALRRVLDKRSEWNVWREAGLQQVRARYAPDTMLHQWQALFDGHLAEVFGR